MNGEGDPRRIYALGEKKFPEKTKHPGSETLILHRFVSVCGGSGVAMTFCGTEEKRYYETPGLGVTERLISKSPDAE
jgi:hypothetical protein